MNTGETDIVKQITHQAPLAPVLLLVKSAGNTLLSQPKEHDLSPHDMTLVFYAWKCINCGNIIDRTIPHDRRKVWLPESRRPSPRIKKILRIRARP